MDYFGKPYSGGRTYNGERLRVIDLRGMHISEKKRGPAGFVRTSVKFNDLKEVANAFYEDFELHNIDCEFDSFALEDFVYFEAGKMFLRPIPTLMKASRIAYIGGYPFEEEVAKNLCVRINFKESPEGIFLPALYRDVRFFYELNASPHPRAEEMLVERRKGQFFYLLTDENRKVEDSVDPVPVEDEIEYLPDTIDDTPIFIEDKEDEEYDDVELDLEACFNYPERKSSEEK